MVLLGGHAAHCNIANPGSRCVASNYVLARRPPPIHRVCRNTNTSIFLLIFIVVIFILIVLIILIFISHQR